MQTNNFVKLALAQRVQGTLYCAGLDIHSFGGYGQSPEQNLKANLDVYKALMKGAPGSPDHNEFSYLKSYYRELANKLPGMKNAELMAELMAAVEFYTERIIDILVYDCNIRVFKIQAAFYEQFGPLGMVLLSKISYYLKGKEKELDTLVANMCDTKKGDIATTQAAYFIGLLSNLTNSWGVDYAPFDFDVINVTPWMGSDVLVLKNDDGTPGLGLQLMQTGKGLIVVNKTSNPSGPQYQELETSRGLTLQMCNVDDLANFSNIYDLEAQGLSTIGLVVGSTHQCDGSIRTAFPSCTLWVPGFGAQGGKFSLVMPELIRSGDWEGQGAAFSSSRGTMYSHLPKLGGSGDIKNIGSDLKSAVGTFRINEKKAYHEANIKYPF